MEQEELAKCMCERTADGSNSGTSSRLFPESSVFRCGHSSDREASRLVALFDRNAVKE